jgi:hypothetical protein
MKLTKNQLKRLIKEEISKLLDEWGGDDPDTLCGERGEPPCPEGEECFNGVCRPGPGVDPTAPVPHEPALPSVPPTRRQRKKKDPFRGL